MKFRMQVGSLLLLRPLMLLRPLVVLFRTLVVLFRTLIIFSRQTLRSATFRPGTLWTPTVRTPVFLPVTIWGSPPLRSLPSLRTSSFRSSTFWGATTTTFWSPLVRTPGIRCPSVWSTVVRSVVIRVPILSGTIPTVEHCRSKGRGPTQGVSDVHCVSLMSGTRPEHVDLLHKILHNQSLRSEGEGQDTGVRTERYPYPSRVRETLQSPPCQVEWTFNSTEFDFPFQRHNFIPKSRINPSLSLSFFLRRQPRIRRSVYKDPTTYLGLSGWNLVRNFSRPPRETLTFETETEYGCLFPGIRHTTPL